MTATDHLNITARQGLLYRLLYSRIGKRVLLVFCALLASYLVQFLMNPFDEYFRQPIARLLKDLLFCLGFSAALCEINLFVDRRLNIYVPWTGKPLNRLIWQALLQVGGCLLLVTAVYVVTSLAIEGTCRVETKAQAIALLQWLVSTIFISLMISAINTGNFLLKNWKLSAVEAMELQVKAAQHQQAAAEAELQGFKLQLDSHFVFNNLSVLSELILEDQQLGYEYSENFAKVYRYLLVNANRDIIALEDELKFLNAYIFLSKKRIGEGVQFDIQVADELLRQNLPPLTLQLLVENALKHNQTIKAHPLLIKIYSNDAAEIVVKNNLLPLVNSSPSPGIGLKNIYSRYALLCNKQPVVEKTADSFIVKVPLM